MGDGMDEENSYIDKVKLERESRVARFERFLSADNPDNLYENDETEEKITSETAKIPNPRKNTKSEKDKPVNIHKGHRQRMRESARRDPELNSFSDVQILEYLLAFATPQRDTNPIAHALLDKFGSLIAVFRASAEELVKVTGVTVAAAEIISTLVKICIWDG